MSEDKNIENLFKQKFDGYSVPNPPGEWAAMGSSLAKTNFLKFGIGHFNVFYLIVGVVTLSLVTVVSLMPSSENELIPAETEILEVAPVIVDTTELPVINENLEQNINENANVKDNDDLMEEVQSSSEVTPVKKTKKDVKLEDNSGLENSPESKNESVNQENEENSKGTSDIDERSSEIIEEDEPAIQKNESNEKIQSNPVIKQVVVVQQDTIVQIDTVKVKKRGRKKKRK
jgi:hypothetical protein